MSFKSFKALFVVAIFVASGIGHSLVNAQCQWQDDDPITSGISGTGNGLSVFQVADPTGDPTRVTVGEVDMGGIGGGGFANINSLGGFSTALAEGQPYSFTVDYFVPSSTTMESMAGPNNAAHTFFIAVSFDGNPNDGTDGFITVDNVMFDTWQTLEVTGTVPMGALTVNPLMIFNNQTAQAFGVALYVDNIKFDFAEGQPTCLYEDLDPDENSPVNNGMTIFAATDGTRTFGDVILEDGPTFKSTGMAGIDVTPYVGETFQAGFDVLIPSSSSINAGDSIFLQMDFFNAAVGPGAFGEGDQIRLTAGFLNENAARDEFLRVQRPGTDVIPAMTDNGNPVDTVNVTIIITDGGFGGTPNDSNGSLFCQLDEFSFCVNVLAPPSGDFVPPAAFTNFRGIVISSDLADFVDSDDTNATYNPGFVLNDLEAPVWLIFDANAPGAIDFIVESQAGTPGLTYTVEAFNYNTSSLEEIGTSPETFNTDSVVSFPITAADHIDTNGDVQARVGWRQTGFTLNFPWEIRVDQVGWNQ